MPLRTPFHLWGHSNEQPEGYLQGSFFVRKCSNQRMLVSGVLFYGTAPFDTIVRNRLYDMSGTTPNLLYTVEFLADTLYAVQPFTQDIYYIATDRGFSDNNQGIPFSPGRVLVVNADNTMTLGDPYEYMGEMQAIAVNSTTVLATLNGSTSAGVQRVNRSGTVLSDGGWQGSWLDWSTDNQGGFRGGQMVDDTNGRFVMMCRASPTSGDNDKWTLLRWDGSTVLTEDWFDEPLVVTNDPLLQGHYLAAMSGSRLGWLAPGARSQHDEPALIKSIHRSVSTLTEGAIVDPGNFDLGSIGGTAQPISTSEVSYLVQSGSSPALHVLVYDHPSSGSPTLVSNTELYVPSSATKGDVADFRHVVLDDGRVALTWSEWNYDLNREDYYVAIEGTAPPTVQRTRTFYEHYRDTGWEDWR